MKASTIDFLTIGELLVDFCQTGRGPNGFPLYEALPGGAPANVAAALAIWGLKVGFIGNVGSDALGTMLSETLGLAGVDCSRLLPSRQPTSLALVSLAADGDRSFAFYWKDSSCSTLSPALATPEICTGARVFHFGSVTLSTPRSRKTSLAAVRQARKSGSLVSFDANLRPALWSWQTKLARKAILAAMKLAHIVKLSEEELYFLSGIEISAGAIGRDDAKTSELMQALFTTSGVDLLFVTFGKDGCRWQGSAGSGILDSLAVNAIDTTGAGDCFMAGVIFKFLRLEKPLGELSADDYRVMALQGVTSGALSTEKRGGIPAIPALSAVMSRLPL